MVGLRYFPEPGAGEGGWRPSELPDTQLPLIPFPASICILFSRLGARKAGRLVPAGESAVRGGQGRGQGAHISQESEKGCLGSLQREFLNPSYDPPSILKQRTQMLNYGSCQC